MDVQDHKKPTSSGHDSHGVHLCHKCGWPFPNPHPSAKHRRAHKRVCGKVEGYKLIDSEAERLSDDEHPSDDDMKTPSPKTEKGSVKELGSSDGIGLKSYKSEEDLFSDAVTEFSDSGVSPSRDKRLESVGQRDINVAEVLVRDLNDSELSKDDGNAGNNTPLDDPKGGSEISNSDVRSEIYQSETTRPIGHIRSEEVSFGVDQIDGLQIDSSAISETVTENTNTNGESGKHKELISSAPETAIEVKRSANEVESFTECVAPLSKSASEAPLSEPRLEETEEKFADPLVVDYLVPEAEENALDTLVPEPRLQEADGNISRPVTVGEIVEQEKEVSNKLQGETENAILEPISDEGDEETSNVSKVVEIDEQEKELTNVLQAELTQHNLFPETDPPKYTDASGTTQIEADSSKDTTVDDHEKLAAVYDFKGEGDKNTHLLSVTEILPSTENAEIMIRDFKDYKVLRSSFPLDLGDAEVTRSVEEDNLIPVSETDPSSISSVPVENLHSSYSDIISLEGSLEKEGVLAPVGGEVDTSGSRVISQEGSGTNALEDSTETSGFEILNRQINYTLEGIQPNSADEETTKSGVSAPSTKAYSDVIPAVFSIDEKTSRQTTDSGEVEDADDNVIDKNDYVTTENGISHTLNEDDTSCSQKCADEVYLQASQGLELGDNTEVLKSGGALGAVSELDPEDNSQVSGKNSEVSNDTEVQKSIGALGTVSELNPEDHGLVSDKNSEVSSSKEPETLPATSHISSKISAKDEDKNTRDAMTFEPLVGEGDGKLTKENLNASAVDNSVVTSSRTESLDGNWGSVSVLSTQSDGTALADTEIISPNATQAEEKTEGTLLKSQAVLKSQAATEESHSDKSDVFEPPSFMTLVESGAGADRKVADSEIDTVLKTEQPKSEALQAGWFPSLTNVVNESEGRNKNEEIIAKVTNWSTGKQHGPLKNLLSEAHAATKVTSEGQKQVPPVNQADQTDPKDNGAAVTTVSSIMGSETPGDNAAKREVEKEWNSPARYPTEIKKEKKKGKPYWVPFVCCTSVHQDV